MPVLLGVPLIVHILGALPFFREAEGIVFLSSQSVFPLAQNENGQTISI